MKEYIAIIIVFSLLLFATPIVFGALSENLSVNSEDEERERGLTPGMKFPETISLLLTETDETVELSAEEYLIGCLFAQISVNYHQEALNAQAVAAHSYLRRLMLDGIDISDDIVVSQAYFTKEKAEERYSNEYDKLLERVKTAAAYGVRRLIVYDGEPIYSVYHSISAGVTNTAYSVWGRDFPYLKSVESSWDRSHPDFLCINEMTSESIRLAMFNYNRTASMPLDYSLWFADPVKNDYGYVMSVNAGESLLSGGDMWRIFNLRSTSFEISFRNSDVFVSETRGHGHGVGLSQYGADVLGRRGYSCEEILLHYYTDVEIVEI